MVMPYVDGAATAPSFPDSLRQWHTIVHRAVLLFIFILLLSTFTSLALEGVHRRQLSLLHNLIHLPPFVPSLEQGTLLTLLQSTQWDLTWGCRLLEPYKTYTHVEMWPSRRLPSDNHSCENGRITFGYMKNYCLSITSKWHTVTALIFTILIFHESTTWTVFTIIFSRICI